MHSDSRTGQASGLDRFDDVVITVTVALLCSLSLFQVLFPIFKTIKLISRFNQSLCERERERE